MTKTNTFFSAVLGLGAALVLAAAPAAKELNIAETAAANGSFNTLLAAAEAAGLAGSLAGDGPFTVFAPTDEAFGNLPKGTVENLLKPENKPQLVALLTYHIVEGSVPSSEALKLDRAETLLGQSLTLNASADGLMVDNARVVTADVNASNGVIHVIDTVLMPNNIIEVAVGAGSFNTLAAALTAAGLVDTLAKDGPFTVFAPTDEAFAKLPAGTVENLLKPENLEQLKAILTLHVVPGAWLASDVAGLESAPTVNGQPLMISASQDGVWVGGAQVVATDIRALNGVIHVIDSVILPATGHSAKTAMAAGHQVHGASCGN